MDFTKLIVIKSSDDQVCCCMVRACVYAAIMHERQRTRALSRVHMHEPCYNSFVTFACFYNVYTCICQGI